jgi:Fic family protein
VPEAADDKTRHSKARDAELVSDPEELASHEARNGLRQFDAVVELIEFHLQPDRPFKLRLSTILHLQRYALEGISAYAGIFRPAGIEIGGSKHQPVGAYQVPEKVEEMCDYVNENWQTKLPLHLAAYVLWRLNWIHPFTDGNGRTARAVSYVVLCLKLGYLLPGTRTIPDQISEDKQPYYKALERADEAFQQDRVNVEDLEQLLAAMLARQLYAVFKDATGAGELAISEIVPGAAKGDVTAQ